MSNLHVPGRLAAMRLYQLRVSHRTRWLVVELETDQGLVGVGECSDATNLNEVPAALDEAAALLADAELEASAADLDAELWTWAETANESGLRFMKGTVAGALTLAICDIAAQAARLPLWEWLGGRARSSIAVYANINRAAGSRRPQDFARLADLAAGDGFQAVKLAPFDGPRLPKMSLVDTGVAHVQAVREVVPAGTAVFVDVHHRLSRAELAQALPRLEALNVGWLEDAVDVLAPQDLAWLTERTSIPLAGGERIVSPDALMTVVAGGYLTYLLLDPKYVGGPLRLKRLLDHVDGVRLTYHNPTGPVGTAMAAHLSTLHRDFAWLEFAYGEDTRRTSDFVPAEQISDGRLTLPAGQGLGTRLRHDVLAEAVGWEWTR